MFAGGGVRWTPAKRNHTAQLIQGRSPSSIWIRRSVIRSSGVATKSSGRFAASPALIRGKTVSGRSSTPSIPGQSPRPWRTATSKSVRSKSDELSTIARLIVRPPRSARKSFRRGISHSCPNPECVANVRDRASSCRRNASTTWAISPNPVLTACHSRRPASVRAMRL